MAWIEQRGRQHRAYWYTDTANKAGKSYEAFASRESAQRLVELISASGGDGHALADFIRRQLPEAGVGCKAGAAGTRANQSAVMAPVGCGVSLVRLCEAFLGSREVDARTIADYRRDIDAHILTYFGDVDIALVRARPALAADDPSDALTIIGWLRWLERKPLFDRFGRPTGRTLSRKSRRNLHGLLYSIFEVAVDDDSVPMMRNPCAKTKLPEACEDEMVFLDHRQAAALVSRINPFFQPLVITLLGTGMRWGEAAGLQVRDLRLDEPVPYLRVRRALVRQDDGSTALGRVKTRKAIRSISLAPEVVRVLRALVEGRAGTCQVFTMPRGGFLHHGNFRYRCFMPAVRACVAAGEVPEGLRIHDLRHTHAAWLISAGRPLRAVKERLGHRSILTTDRYTHLLPTVDKDDLAVIQQALVGTTVPLRGDDTHGDQLAA